MSNTEAIDKRYTVLAEKSCCLSCGGAINHGKPAAGEVCVDLGSGRGNDVLRMADMVGDRGFVYGIDISEGMLKKARNTAAKFGVKNVEFKQSVIERIPLPDTSVDLLISNCTINHADDKAAVWAEVFRVLKPGGRFAVSDIYALEPVPDRYRNDPAAVAECWAGAVTREEYMETLAAPGFSKLTIVEESEPYAKGRISVASFTVTGRRE